MNYGYPILFEYCNFDEARISWTAMSAVEINTKNDYELPSYPQVVVKIGNAVI